MKLDLKSWTPRLPPLLTLLLLLVSVWLWFYWGWHDEQQVLIALKADPDYVGYAPILTPWPKQHLGPAGFVLDRVVDVNLNFRTDLAPLGGLKSLRLWTVPQETISQSQVEPLRRDLPDCRVIRL